MTMDRPRSHERGNARSSPRPPPQLCRFNGAAFSRTRKLCPLNRLARMCHSPGFNGAAFSRTRKTNAIAVSRWSTGCKSASMGPRSHERGNLIDNSLRNIPMSSTGFNGAAFSRTRKTVRYLRAVCTRLVAAKKLQWGRVLTNAETGLSGWRRALSNVNHRCCFNGAAFSRTRKLRVV